MAVSACAVADIRRDPPADGPAVTTSSDSIAARCLVPIPKAEAAKRILTRLDDESPAFGIEAFGLDPEACRTATRLTALPAAPTCEGIFPWTGGDVDHRRQVLGAAGARFVASADIDGLLYQTLVIFDETSAAPAQLAAYASQCGTGPEQTGRNGVRRWKIAANAAWESWLLISAGTVLHLRFDQEIGDGFTPAQIQRIADKALQAATVNG